MKKLLWIILILTANNLFSQEGKIYTWEEVQEAHIEPLKVENLSLRHSKLTGFPLELQKFKNLKYLDLSKNKWGEIPPIFNGFDSLKIIKIERDKLKQFPVAICQMVNLEEIRAFDNQFITIPACIRNLQHLKILDLSDNMIENLPKELQQLPHLQQLTLTGMILDKYFQREWTERLPNVKIEFGQPCDCLSH